MSDIHIDDFYRDTAKIMVTLYNQFPRKMTLYVEDVSGADKPDEFGLHSPRHLACFHTMLWLAGANYMSYEAIIRQEAIEQAVLSHRSFLLLNSSLSSPYAATSAPPHLPAVVAEQEFLIINRIRKELKEGTSYSLADLIRQVMGLSRQFG